MSRRENPTKHFGGFKKLCLGVGELVLTVWTRLQAKEKEEICLDAPLGDH
jgi:hypothetical protein